MSSPIPYYDLAKRLEDSFAEIDNDIVTELFSRDVIYRSLRHETDQMRRDHPLIEKVLEDDGAISLNEAEHKVLARYVELVKQMEDLERRHIYFRGHTDGFVYLKKIGVI